MWEPLSQDELLEMIDNAEWLMEPAVKAFWERIKILPQKWQLPLIGDMGAGFWVVAVVGQRCIFYNDIEEGYNWSLFEKFGQISEYQSNQSDLLPFIRGYWQDFTAEVSSDA